MKLIDQIGHPIEIKSLPKRIVSLVPSQTEFLFDIGLETSIVGITTYCIHPKEKVSHVHKIGGTKNCRLDSIEALQPDLIIANKEENSQQDILQLQQKYAVYTSDIKNLDDSYGMMADLAAIFDRTAEATIIIDQIKTAMYNLKSDSIKPAVYFIWRKPWMSVGNDTFIHYMMEQLGFANLMASHSRYPELAVENLALLNPEYILLSSEPFPFKQRHVDELQAICPNTKIIMVDGEMFSWYGSRLQHIEAYVKQSLWPLLKQ